MSKNRRVSTKEVVIIFSAYRVLRLLVFFSFFNVISLQIVNAAEITIDLFSFSYREIDKHDQFFMEDKSDPVFYSLGLRDWGDFSTEFIHGNSSWSLLYTFEYSFGNANYSSAGTGKMKKEYYKRRFEYYFSKNPNLNRNRIQPFFGFGYRDLFDDSGFKRSSTDHLGYDRHSQYYYIPIGAIWHINNNLSLKSQYNYFVEGKQTSFLYEILPTTYNTNPINTQRLGWGIDINMRSRINMTWSTYGFYRVWNIEDSDMVSCSELIYCIEPKNFTHEAGIGISYHF